LRTEVLCTNKDSLGVVRSRKRNIVDIDCIMRGNPHAMVKKYDLFEN